MKTSRETWKSQENISWFGKYNEKKIIFFLNFILKIGETGKIIV
jgi:hypothetical protein